MKLRTFDSILSFALGAIWAFILIGAFVTYSLFSFLGFIPALFMTFLFIFVSLILLLLLETLHMYRQDFEEKRKQTVILEEIRDRLKA
jgi:hypothetical protein